MSLTSAVDNLKSEAEQFFEAIAADVSAWAGDVETVVVDDAKVAWIALYPVLTAVGPAQWKILQGLVATASKDLAADDFTGVVQDVLAQAAAAELAWSRTLELFRRTLNIGEHCRCWLTSDLNLKPLTLAN